MPIEVAKQKENSKVENEKKMMKKIIKKRNKTDTKENFK